MGLSHTKCTNCIANILNTLYKTNSFFCVFFLKTAVYRIHLSLWRDYSVCRIAFLTNEILLISNHFFSICRLRKVVFQDRYEWTKEQ